MKKLWLLPLIVLLTLFCAAAAAQEQAEWTVLWYLCGTDLESEDGSATYNLDEAIAGMGTEDVNVIVVTGGTKEWQNSAVPNDAICIFRLDKGGLTELNRLRDGNMADAGLLSSMIQRVFSEYPAKRSMLLLWDHGGGSVGGVAFDERTDDSISLMELQAALAQGGQRFDIIGFDACLMATLELANALAPYGGYMVASQELEPGGGWNYRELMKTFAQNPAIAPDALGKIICDSYLQHCIAWDDKEIATLSLVNLAKVPALVEAFDAMAWQLTAVAGNPAAIQTYRQGVNKARSFGGNNRAEGYTHMVDMGELVINTEGVWDSVGLTVLDRLFETVEYAIDGSTHQKSSGLSVFFPFTADTEVGNACAVIAEAPVSKAYMRFVDTMVPSFSVPDDMNQTLVERPEAKDTALATPAPIVDTVADAPIVQLDPADYQVSFFTEIDADGYYTLYVDGGLDTVEEVQFKLYLIDEEEDTAVLLGTDNDIDADWDNGVFQDNFRGVWLTINGEYCSPILIDAQDDYNLYTIPIELNGERTNLRVMFVIESEDEDGFVTGSYQVVGVWDGTNEQTGIAARDIRPLKDGDVILPLFDAYPPSDIGGAGEEWAGYEVTAGRNGTVTLAEQDLFNGEYYYTFLLTDIFGQAYESDGVSLYMEGDGIYIE